MTAIRIIDDHIELAGLAGDDHTQYPLLAGRAGGQTLIGGITTIADLTLQTTSGVGATGADMHFLTGNNGATEAMTILNNGDVGIGTMAPGAKLTVLGGDIVVREDDDGNDAVILSSGNTAGTLTLNGGGLAKLFLTGGGGDNYFNGGGKVGIGTSTPKALLELSMNNPQLLMTDFTEALNKKCFRFINMAQEMRLTARTDGNISNADGGDVMTWERLGNIGISTNAPTAKLDVNSDILRLRTAKTPATAGATGNQGDICWDANYLYVCTATNAWERAALASW